MSENHNRLLSVLCALNNKLILACSAATAMLTALATCSILMGSDATAISINTTIMVLACALGWLMGTLMTPYDPAERADFSAYAKAASAFISGYLLGKIDKVIEHILTPAFLSDPLTAFRTMLFLAAFCVCVLLTFIFRRYANSKFHSPRER